MAFIDSTDSTKPSISHTRSRSDEAKGKSLPNSPENQRSNAGTDVEFAGMHALQTLTENLESTIQKRLNSGGSTSSTPKPCSTSSNESDSKETNGYVMNKEVLVRCSSTSSLRKLALINSSPLLSKKEPVKSDTRDVDEEEDEDGDDDTFNEDFLTPTAVRRLNESCNKPMGGGNKRFTWHNFDSLEALKGIEEAKYGPNVPTSGKSLTLPLDKTLSKSSEMISSSTKKTSSLKRSIMRRFTHVLNRVDEPGSTSKKDKKKLKVRY